MSGLASLKRVPRKGALFAFCGLLFLCGLPPTAVAAQCIPFQVDEWASVSYIYDGDTIKLGDGRKVRLIGINAPEVGHDGNPAEPLAEVARQALQEMLAGQARIALRYESERLDHYGRLLAHLYLSDQSSVQERLLEQGLAAAVVITPNVANLDCYFSAEARAHGRGIWQQLRFSGYETDQLPQEARGFYIIQGRVERIGESSKALWLNFANQGGAKVVVRIDKKDLPNFESGFDARQLRGKKIRVRGWLSERRGELQMRLYHPAALRRLNQ